MKFLFVAIFLCISSTSFAQLTLEPVVINKLNLQNFTITDPYRARAETRAEIEKHCKDVSEYSVYIDSKIDINIELRDNSQLKGIERGFDHTETVYCDQAETEKFLAKYPYVGSETISNSSQTNLVYYLSLVMTGGSDFKMTKSNKASLTETDTSMVCHRTELVVYKNPKTNSIKYFQVINKEVGCSCE